MSFSIRFDAVPPLTWKTPYSQLEVRGGGRERPPSAGLLPARGRPHRNP